MSMIAEDTGLYLPPSNTPLSGLPLNQRLPSGNDERVRRVSCLKFNVLNVDYKTNVGKYYIVNVITLDATILFFVAEIQVGPDRRAGDTIAVGAQTSADG